MSADPVTNTTPPARPRHRGVYAHTVALALAACALGALASCRTPRTEIVVTIDSDLTYGPAGALDSVVIVVRSAGQARVRITQPLGAAEEGRVALPVTLGLLPRSDYAGEPVAVEVFGCAAGGCDADDPARNAVVVQRATASFTPRVTNELHVRLARNCAWVHCIEGLSCDAATRECRDAGEATLAEYGTDAGAPDAGTPPAATALAAGWNHSCALDPEGSPRCWGDNRRGQLGDGSTEPRNGAVRVGGALGGAVTQLAPGLDHTCALLRDGTVQCWGDDTAGQLGTGGAGATPVPGAVVPGLRGVVQLSAGARHTCAVLRDGGVRCWGDNGSGQLGDGTMRARNVPVAVSSGGGELRDVVEVSAGEAHTCAWLRDGTVRCWGDNHAGQLGDGGAEDVALTPVVVPGVDHVVGVAAGGEHTCARTSTHVVWCWGRNDRGQLGADLLDASSFAAVPVVNLPPRIAALVAGADHACVRTSEGGVSCWGDNEAFQLGDTSGFRRTPTVIAASDVVAVDLAAGRAHTCVIRAGAGVSCWGDNTFAQRGAGAEFARTTPGEVHGVSGALRVVAGADHACALRADGTAVCWGDNRRGQLGDGTARTPSAPVQVKGLVGATDLTAGAAYACAIVQLPRSRADVALRPPQVYCWGANSSGQLGDGTLVDAYAPVRTVNVNGAVSVAASIGGAGQGPHTCALDAVGRLFCWGDDSAGQLGIAESRSAPTIEPLLALLPFGLGDPATMRVRAGAGFTCAAAAHAPAMYCAGRNDLGQLGSTDWPSPSDAFAVIKFEFDAVEDFSLGRGHGCLVDSSNVECWGDNAYGQAGAEPSTVASLTAPTAVTGLPGGAAEVSAGATHTCAVVGGRGGGADALFCWGDNREGQLGDGTTTSRAAPAPVTGLLPPGNFATGDGFTCAIAGPDARVFCWGRARDGQLGLGAQPGDQTPSTVEGW